ncbi:endonuclease G, mitochondrial [Tremella mesenterica]|uniref:Endonuclease G, mitochondrial n=1 Tax=Tremella mesenterica TaxID=5217 RepID=A0A4Q1BSX9_TREME|nr:endonuclease G, mitochondrial [Tremella mesenterica]
MPTLGPSLLFAAGLTLGIGAGVLYPRRSRDELPPIPPPPPTSSKKEIIKSIALPSGSVRLHGGFPGPTPDIIQRTAYTAAYDRRLRHPAWTAEHLTAASLAKTPPLNLNGDRSKSVFMEDEGIPEMFRAKLSDCASFSSIYPSATHVLTIGVPAADAKISQQAMDETFFLTNIAPQVGDGFNRHYWAYVEDFCRRLTTNFEDVYVFTVPLYLPSRHPDGKWRVVYEVIGDPPSVSVPTHFAKVVLASRPDFSYPQSPSKGDKMVTATSSVKELAMGAFVLPNQEIPDGADLRSFIAPVESVERASGLQLFNTNLKSKSRQLCAVTQCQVIVRRFDDARKELGPSVQGRKSSVKERS